MQEQTQDLPRDWWNCNSPHTIARRINALAKSPAADKIDKARLAGWLWHVPYRLSADDMHGLLDIEARIRRAMLAP